MRRFLLTVATAATALTATACSDIAGVNGNIAGIYELQTINGRTLPATFDDEFGSVTYLYGEVELDNDGTFVDMYQYRVLGGRVETEQTFGTWERSGDRIRFETDQGSVYSMQRTSTNRLVYVDSDDGSRWVYERF